MQRVPQVVAYLIRFREIGVAVRSAIKSLNQGIPPDAYKIQEIPDTWRWPEARHWITFVVEQTEGRQWIVVTTVQSVDEG